MSIASETRRESYDNVINSLRPRHKIILKILNGRELTAHEIAETLVKNGCATQYERNLAAPRLTELKRMGLVVVVGKRICPITGRNVAVWARMV